jgi:uncharacterized membrane protein
MIAGWVLKLASHPQTAHSWQDFLHQARIGALPGLATLLFLLVFLLHLFYLAKRGQKSHGGREIIHSQH